MKEKTKLYLFERIKFNLGKRARSFSIENKTGNSSASAVETLSMKEKLKSINLSALNLIWAKEHDHFISKTKPKTPLLRGWLHASNNITIRRISHGIWGMTEPLWRKHGNRVQSWRISIEITIFRLIWHQSQFCLVPIELEKCNYKPNLISRYNGSQMTVPPSSRSSPPKCLATPLLALLL